MKLATAVLGLAAALLLAQAAPTPAAHSYANTRGIINAANYRAPALPVEVVVDDALDFTLALSPDAHRPAQLGADGPLPLPTLEAILAGAARAWPEQPAKAQRVAVCELGADVASGAYPAAVVFDVNRRTGGPMQIDAPTWAPYFADRWTWPTVVLDLDAHFEAAREIYELAGGWSPWPWCGR